jgi:hypothetical protein
MYTGAGPPAGRAGPRGAERRAGRAFRPAPDVFAGCVSAASGGARPARQAACCAAAGAALAAATTRAVGSSPLSRS